MKRTASKAKHQAHITEAIEVEPSSGNVFADLGLPDPEERLLKAELSILIERAIEARGLSQTEAAQLLGTDQAKVSLVVNGRLAGFSVERLLRFLLALDLDVTISVSPTPPGRPGRIVVDGLEAAQHQAG